MSRCRDMCAVCRHADIVYRLAKTLSHGRDWLQTTRGSAHCGSRSCHRVSNCLLCRLALHYRKLRPRRYCGCSKAYRPLWSACPLSLWVSDRRVRCFPLRCYTILCWCKSHCCPTLLPFFQLYRLYGWRYYSAMCRYSSHISHCEVPHRREIRRAWCRVHIDHTPTTARSASR